MIIAVEHVGRTGKLSSIMFDTDKKVYTNGWGKHDVYIWAEQTRDVKHIISDLLKLKFKHVAIEEFY